MKRGHGDPWGVEGAYDAIAPDWAASRGAPWDAVRRFLREVPQGARVLDVGAGSARYAAIEESRGLRWVAVDFSRELLRIRRREEGPPISLVRADARSLPLRDASTEVGLLVAVLHHLPTEKDRQGALREVRRALKPGSPLMASAWSVTAPAHRNTRPAPGGGERDFIISFSRASGAPVDRFFHLYEKGELAKEVRSAGFQGVREWAEADNHFVKATS